jgi:hypothetical protein
MAYVTEAQVQQWLQATKYNITSLDDELVAHARDVAFSLVSRRYDTSTWVDDATTAEMVLNLMTMLVASYTLRRVIGEDDGGHDYPDWLESRATTLLEQLSTGTISIPGVPTDGNSPEGGVPTFWPTEQATDLWFEDPHAEGAAARAFDMQQIF